MFLKFVPALYESHKYFIAEQFADFVLLYDFFYWTRRFYFLYKEWSHLATDNLRRWVYKVAILV